MGFGGYQVVQNTRTAEHGKIARGSSFSWECQALRVTASARTSLSVVLWPFTHSSRPRSRMVSALASRATGRAWTRIVRHAACGRSVARMQSRSPPRQQSKIEAANARSDTSVMEYSVSNGVTAARRINMRQKHHPRPPIATAQFAAQISRGQRVSVKGCSAKVSRRVATTSLKVLPPAQTKTDSAPLSQFVQKCHERPKLQPHKPTGSVSASRDFI